MGHDLHVEYRVYVNTWAAQHALALQGDFVECGTNTGIYARAITSLLDFSATPKHFYLVDTFEGVPSEKRTQAERDANLPALHDAIYPDVYTSTADYFSRYSNVTLIRGRIPESLDPRPAERVAYLSIDMNAVIPEIAAIEFFWDKLVSGAAVVLDDYGFRFHEAQKEGFDRFAQAHGVSILALPTGQGLILKP